MVFIIGLYVHPRGVWRQLHQVLRAGAAMRAMQAELATNPAAGCLAVRHTEALGNPTRLVQIWRRRARPGAAGVDP